MYYKSFIILVVYIDNFKEKQKYFYNFYDSGRFSISLVLLWIKENAVVIDIYLIKYSISCPCAEH